MSYDIWLEIDTGGGHTLSTDFSNYTSNVSGMWEEALGYSLADLNNKLAKECIEDLKDAVDTMYENPEYYTSLNPENSWGNYEGALEYLEWVLRECRRHPNCRVKVDR